MSKRAELRSNRSAFRASPERAKPQARRTIITVVQQRSPERTVTAAISVGTRADCSASRPCTAIDISPDGPTSQASMVPVSRFGRSGPHGRHAYQIHSDPGILHRGRRVSSRRRQRCIKIRPNRLSAGLHQGTATQPATSGTRDNRAPTRLIEPPCGTRPGRQRLAELARLSTARLLCLAAPTRGRPRRRSKCTCG